MADHTTWPPLPYAEWAPTSKTLHQYTQMLGKLKLALQPPLPQWLHTGLQLDSRGFVTGPLLTGGRAVDAGIDVVDGVLWLRAGSDPAVMVPLTGDRSVADVWGDFRAGLARLQVVADIWEKPQEMADATLFSANTHDRAFDTGQAARFHRALCSIGEVFDEFRSGFFGRTGVQFWWGAFDLAVLLFSGRHVHPPDDRGYIMRYDLDAEHLNAGLWPGDDSSPHAAFYAYLHPRPDGCATVPIEPAKAGWVEAMGEWLLPYDEVRKSDDPGVVLLGFLNSVYRVAVSIGGWDAKDHTYQPPPRPDRR